MHTRIPSQDITAAAANAPHAVAGRLLLQRTCYVQQTHDMLDFTTGHRLGASTSKRHRGKTQEPSKICMKETDQVYAAQHALLDLVACDGMAQGSIRMMLYGSSWHCNQSLLPQ
jgi:hypothetical protein